MALVNVMTKARKRFGKVYPAERTNYWVEVEHNVGIKIYKQFPDGNIKLCREFIVGQTAEYDSYNLTYTGAISKITDKGVTIIAYPGTRMAKAHRLDMNTFCWRNWDFNAEETARRNAEEMMYI